MIAGRIGAIVMSKKRRGQDGGKRRRMSEEEIERLKEDDCKWHIGWLDVEEEIEDMDIRENTSYKLRFRKIPYSFWVMGSLFWAGGIFVIYMIYEDLLVFEHYR